MTVAFLFLTINEPITLFKHWIDTEKCNIYLHNKYDLVDTFWSKYSIEHKVPTEWGTMSLILATIELLKEALENEENTHFILISDSCVPLKPFDDTIQQIEMCQLSCMKKHTAKNICSQWITLIREDAIKICEGKIIKPKFRIPDEAFFLEFFITHNLQYADKSNTYANFKHPIKKGCGQSPRTLEFLDSDSEFEDCLFYRKVSNTTSYNFYINELKNWDNLLTFWKSQGNVFITPIKRNIAALNAINDIIDLIKSNDQQMCIQHTFKTLSTFTNLIPCLYNSEKVVFDLWLRLNHQLYLGSTF